MTDLHKDSNLINLLRIGAILGVSGAALAKVLAAEPLQQNQDYGFYALGFIALAICLILFTCLPGTTFKILKNPDLLVPVGLYLTAHENAGRLVGNAGFALFGDGKHLIGGISAMILTSWILQISIMCCFLGWMTRILLSFTETGRVDLIGSFKGIGNWFPRTLGVISLSMIPILISATMLLPAYASGNRQSLMNLLIPAIVLIAILALVWNLLTAAVLPYVLSVDTGLWQAIRKGIGASWSNRSKTTFPIILLMIASGWVVFISVNYTETKTSEKETPFGEISDSYTSTVTKNSKWNFSSKFTWTVDYPEKSEWHPKLMDAVEQKPLPSVDFRIMLLMLFLSLAVNMKIVGAIWENEDTLHAEIEDGGHLGAGIAVITILLVFMVPFEYFIGPKRDAGNVKLPDGTTQELLAIPKIYTGAETFSKNELFRYEKTQEEKDHMGTGDAVFVGMSSGGSEIKVEPVQLVKKYGPDPDRDQLNDIYAVYAGEVDSEPGTDILAAGYSKAFVLTPDGKVKREFEYNLGKYPNGEDWQRYGLSFINIADLDGDGRPEILGHAIDIAAIVDLEGKIIWKYPGKTDDDSVDALTVGDIDNDGQNEILVSKGGAIEAYSREGRRKWTKDTSQINERDLAVADVDQDGKNEVIAGQTLLNAAGKVMKEIEKPYSADGYLNEKGEPFRLIFFDRNQIGLFDANGLRTRLDAPLSQILKEKKPDDPDFMNMGTTVYGADARYVKFDRGPTYLAVWADANDGDSYEYFKILYIYDSAGKLVYHETLLAFNGKIGVVPNEDGSESLLVTDDGKIFKYSLN